MKDIEKMRRNKRHHKYLSSNNGKRGLQIRRWILILFILIGGAGAFGLGAYLAVRVDEHGYLDAAPGNGTAGDNTPAEYNAI